MECPPTELDFRQIGASCACGVVRQPPTGFVRISERGTLFFVGEAVVALRQLISSCTDTKLLYKDTLSFALSASIPAFLCRKEAQRKAKKRNAKGRRAKGNFLKKVSSGLLQKLSHNRCREVGGRTPAPASGMCGKRTQSAASAIQPHRRWFSKVFAGVRGRLFQKAPPSRPSLSPARTMSPGAASCGRRV